MTARDVIYVLYIHQCQLTRQCSVEQKMDVFPGQWRGALTVGVESSLKRSGLSLNNMSGKTLLMRRINNTTPLP